MIYLILNGHIYNQEILSKKFKKSQASNFVNCASALKKRYVIFSRKKKTFLIMALCNQIRSLKYQGRPISEDAWSCIVQKSPFWIFF